MGWECDAHHGYHINSDLYPLRIVNERGEAVAVRPARSCSNLINRGTVLLNYRPGDLASRIDGPC